MKRSDLPYRFVKRAFDICFSAGAVAVLLVPGVALGVAISLDSPGSPIFRQKRVGKNGKEIRIFKFRSMHSDANEHPERYLNDAQMAQWVREQKVSGDPRITRVGKFIRRTSVDEIPQFLNVIAGDMSVVGPRPVTLSETFEYGEHRDEVLSVRSGIAWDIIAPKPGAGKIVSGARILPAYEGSRVARAVAA